MLYGFRITPHMRKRIGEEIAGGSVPKGRNRVNPKRPQCGITGDLPETLGSRISAKDTD